VRRNIAHAVRQGNERKEEPDSSPNGIVLVHFTTQDLRTLVGFRATLLPSKGYKQATFLMHPLLVILKKQRGQSVVDVSRSGPMKSKEFVT
jgi:hypothetical protein